MEEITFRDANLSSNEDEKHIINLPERDNGSIVG